MAGHESRAVMKVQRTPSRDPTTQHSKTGVEDSGMLQKSKVKNKE